MFGVSTVLFMAVGRGWETLAVLVDVTRLATTESEDKFGRYFSYRKSSALRLAEVGLGTPGP